jgi:hypothetical protein
MSRRTDYTTLAISPISAGSALDRPPYICDRNSNWLDRIHPLSAAFSGSHSYDNLKWLSYRYVK